MIGIPVGLLYANAFEWVVHKHMLHGLGRNKKSFWSFHWHDHHKKARHHDMVDEAYTDPKPGWNPRTKEIASLVGGAVLHLPLLPVAPFFTLTVVACAVNYYRVHRRAHLDDEWAKEHLPWHYDHHMAPNQDANWCVTHPLFDYIMGTREEYYGTDRWREDEAKKAAHRAKASTPPTGGAVAAAAA